MTVSCEAGVSADVTDIAEVPGGLRRAALVDLTERHPDRDPSQLVAVLDHAVETVEAVVQDIDWVLITDLADLRLTVNASQIARCP